MGKTMRLRSSAQRFAQSASGSTALVCLLLTAPVLAGSEPSPSDAVVKAGEHLRQGALSDGIDLLEQQSDQGNVHPDLSFDRGVLYLQRALSAFAKPGDLAQAAAAFQEAAWLNPDDDQAMSALQRTREEIAAGQHGREDAPVRERPGLLRALVSLLGENGWAWFGLAGSLVLSVALVLGWRTPRGSARRLALTAGATAGAVVLVVGGGFAWGGRTLRVRYAPAVVLASEVVLLDEMGRPAKVGGVGPARAALVPGATVYVSEVRGGLMRLELQSGPAWVRSDQLRLLASSSSGGVAVRR